MMTAAEMIACGTATTAFHFPASVYGTVRPLLSFGSGFYDHTSQRCIEMHMILSYLLF